MIHADATEVAHQAKNRAHWVEPEGDVQEKLDELGQRNIGAEFSDTTGQAEITGTESRMNLDTTITNTDTNIFSLSGDRVTIGRAGTYLIDVRLSVAGTVQDGAAYGVEVYLKVNGSESADSKFYASRSTLQTLGVVSKTGAYTVASGDDVVLCDASGAAFTVTLPSASDGKQRVYIKKTDSSANAVTIDGASAETVDDSTTRVLSLQYDSVTLVSDGSEWWIV